MSISTLRSNQQRRRRRRRRQMDLNVSTDCSLEGHYNFIENSSGFHSAYSTKTRKVAKAMKNAIEEKKTNTLKAVQKTGLVNTKISVYEKNLGNGKDDYKQLRDSKRKKPVIGVPLVGMSNNTVISNNNWKNHNGEEQAQMNINNSKTIRSKAASATSARKERTSTKRRAPAVPNIINSEPIPQFTRIDDFKRSSQNSNISHPSKFTKNPYMTARNNRDFYQIRELAKVSISTMQPQPTFISLRSSGSKRKTLYAKDADGEEAIRVLSNLCLNPLARNSKRASFMMW